MLAKERMFVKQEHIFQRKAKIMGTIKPYTLKNGKKRWEIQGYASYNRGTGKPKHYHLRSFTSYLEANAKVKELEAGYANDKFNNTHLGDMRMSEYLEEWLTEIETDVKTGTTIRHRFIIDHYLIPNVGKFRLKDYTLRDHQQFINFLFRTHKYGKPNPSTGRKQGLRWYTVHGIDAVLSAAFRDAVRLGYVDTNPTHGVVYPKEFRPTNGRRALHYYTADQVDKFLDKALDERDGLMWYLFYLNVFDAGLRKGEVTGLWCKDVDLQNNLLHIRRERLFKAETPDTIVYDDPKTESSIRNVPMTSRLTDGFYSYLRHRFNVTSNAEVIMSLKQYPEEPIFVHLQGQTTGMVIRERTTNSTWTRIVKRAGLPHIRLHDGRHTNAVRMRQAGVSLEDIGGILGHKNVKTTEIYAEITPDVKEKAIQKMDDFNQNSHSNVSIVNQSVNHSDQNNGENDSRKES